MEIILGGEGGKKARMVLPQGCSLDFSVSHTDDAGNVIDHTGSVAHMSIQTKKKVNYVLDSCCSCSATGVTVSIGPNDSMPIPVGTHNWDLIVTKDGKNIRMLYGPVEVIDTYALDEV